MKLRPVAQSHFFLVAILLLSPGLAFGQSPIEFAGKWVLDLDKMANVHPEWQGELTRDLWIATGYSGRVLRISRGVEVTEVRRADDDERYDLDGATTRIPYGDSRAEVVAHWEQDRVVATVTPLNGDPALIRRIYRDEQWLVIEESEEGSGPFRWYFVKT